ncbi:MAG TPA: glycosyltransferase family 1 protein [Chloroflexota bacterium]|nr:glycosyltransferase family 1 protein [Chloroflexota bacterium]
MRIAIDASRAARPNQTGTEAYSRHLIDALVPLAGRHRVLLYYDRTPDALVGGATTRVVPLPRLWTHLRLSLEMLRERPDVLFVPSHVVPPVHPRATVVTVHDLGYLRYRLAYPPAAWIYLAVSTIWSARAASEVVVDSWATRRDLVRHTRVDPARVHVVHLGVEPRFRPLPPAEVGAALGRLGLAPGYLLFVGTLQPRKNLPRLLRAYALAQGEAAMPRLVVAGALGHRAADLRWPEGAWHLGRAPPADLPALYGGAAGFVFPSLFEGFGLPPLEAMACGTPVLAGANSSMPEVVGDAGLLVDATSDRAIADGLVRLATDGDLRADLRRRGLARAAGFTWERTARQTLAVLERAASLSS